MAASKSASKPFVSDIKNIRKRAREHIERGAVTEGYKADRETVIKILNEALATELVCVLRYKYHYYMASGINAQSVAAEFLEHANEEQGHADRIAERITQLGGAPNLSPEGLLTRSHSDYVEGDDLVDMIKENLVAERIAIDSYREIVTYLGNADPTTRRIMEEILAVEEEHADDMSTLLEALVPLCRGAGVPLFMNDRPDLALLADVDGVHLGQDDLPLSELRRLCELTGKRLWVGISTHDAEQLELVLAQRPDYVAFGPVGATAQVAGGAQVMVFTTDRGSAFGCSSRASGGHRHDRDGRHARVPLLPRRRDDVHGECDGGRGVFSGH